VKLCLPVLMMCALAAPPAVLANEAEGKVKVEKADKKADKDKADDKKAEKDDAEKGKAEKEKAEKDKSEQDPQKPADPNAPAQPAEAAAAPQKEEERDDETLDLAEPDFTVVNLPTTLRMPKYKSAFRVTHRFARPLGEGSFGSLAEDFFGLDASAQIGLEFRFGIFPGTQVGIYRTSDKTIQFFGQYDVKHQSATFPVSINAYASIDGTNNFKDSYSPALGAVISRTINKHAAVYVAPFWVNNTNDLPSELTDDNDTVMVGIGTRLRIHGGTYFVAEWVPRVSGFDPGVHSGSFGIEKRVGGHAFQLNFSNSFGTTMGQVARGGPKNINGDQDWYLGFNISRKFF
jgi:Membrane bound beta barrel domain (DUF5777)